MPDDLPAIDITSHLLPLDLPAQLCFYGGGHRFCVQSGDEGKVIRANRAKLKDWLAMNITVKWDAKAVKIEEDGGSVIVRFADGFSATGDVLVRHQARKRPSVRSRCGSPPEPDRDSGSGYMVFWCYSIS